MLSWREASSLEPCLFTEELPVLRRAHLLRRAHQQWGGLTPVRLQWDQFQREATHQYQIIVEGFSIQSSQFASAANSVDLGAFMRGHLPRAHLLHLDLCFSLDQAAIVSGSSIFCTCCIPPSILLIYRHISQTGFPRGGFYPGSC
jgi:hypothetical protein